MSSRWPRLWLLVVSAVVASSCAVSGLQFREDDRLELTFPGYRERVTMPLSITWRVDHDFEITGPTDDAREDAGYFAVLVDVEPMPPGAGLDHYARDDRNCDPSSGCPDEQYLQARGVYVTSSTQLVIERLAPAPGVRLERGDRDRHEVTIVLLDGRGRRIGESAWRQPFEVVRP